MRSNFLLSLAIAGLCHAGMVMPGCAGKNEPKALVASAQVAPATTTPTGDSSSSLPADSLILPGDIKVLKAAVEQAQMRYVPASHNEFDCYTDVMYNRFREGNSALKIAGEVMKLKEIRAAILTLRAMPAADMKKEISKLRLPLRKTWSQLGRISSEGQTDAGQKAELLIANAIADKVLQCCQDPGWSPSLASL